MPIYDGIVTNSHQRHNLIEPCILQRGSNQTRFLQMRTQLLVSFLNMFD